MAKKRYSIGMKVIAIAAQLVFAVILALMLVVLSALLQKNILDFGDLKNKSFESSSYFSTKFLNVTEEIFHFIDLRRKFETDGNYDDAKLVDVRSYFNNRQLNRGVLGEPENARTVSYSLGDLAEWSRGYSMSQYEFVSKYYLDNGICQEKSIYKDGEPVLKEEKHISSLGEMTAELQESVVQNVEHYYGGSYSMSMVSDGWEVSAVAQAQTDKEEDEESSKKPKLDQIVQRVIAGDLYNLNEAELTILLKEMDLSFAQCHSNYQFVDEDYLPKGGVGIWDAFLKGESTMREMCDNFEALEFTLENIGVEVNLYKKCLNRYNLTENGTNVSYWISIGNDDVTYTNISQPIDRQLAEYGEKAGKYIFYQENDVRLMTNVKEMEDAFYNGLEPKYGGKGNVFFVCVDTSFPNQDEFLAARDEYDKMHPWIYISIFGTAASILISLICLIYLSIAAGRREEGGEVHLNMFDRFPTEIMFAMAVAEGILLMVLLGRVMYRFNNEELAGRLFMTGVLAFFGVASFLVFYLSFIRRIRAGVLWNKSILGWFVNGLLLMFSNWRTSSKMLFWFGLHFVACMMFFCLVVNHYDLMPGILFFFLLSGVEAVFIIRDSVQRGKVLEGIRKIASGDLEYKIDREQLRGDNRQLAEAVNTIGDGLFHAVEGSVKNEHLKADLITNVSHDIKTPLTSIINYVDLLKREKLENERVQGYIAVLDAKSQRLKQLTEDLVEASKITSGNIKLEMERIDLVELVHQTEGEFDEKFEDRGLKVITKLPKEPVVVMADGRRIWRVLENLYNNVAKYAMEHTRVYVDMAADGAYVWFSIKNISENALNIQAEELTERFIRGDISRSTEGSGLGLSIAKDLTNLMGGEFEIYLDGDLFKVMIGFRQEQARAASI